MVDSGPSEKWVGESRGTVLTSRARVNENSMVMPTTPPPQPQFT